MSQCVDFTPCLCWPAFCTHGNAAMVRGCCILSIWPLFPSLCFALSQLPGEMMLVQLGTSLLTALKATAQCCAVLWFWLHMQFKHHTPSSHASSACIAPLLLLELNSHSMFSAPCLPICCLCFLYASYMLGNRKLMFDSGIDHQFRQTTPSWSSLSETMIDSAVKHVFSVAQHTRS